MKEQSSSYQKNVTFRNRTVCQSCTVSATIMTQLLKMAAYWECVFCFDRSKTNETNSENW